VKRRRQRGHGADLGEDDLDNRVNPASSEVPVGRGSPILGAADANKVPPSKHQKDSNRKRSLCAKWLILCQAGCLQHATQGKTQIREISTPSILNILREVCMMARKITRRGLIGLGLLLGAMATLYPFLRWGYEITQPLRHAAARGVWFEKIGEAPSDGEVELRFVDEAGNPAEFSALLLWEPTGEAEEVYIRGRLRLPRRELAHRVDKWKEFLGRRGEPPKTENTLLTILPISTPGEALPYTALLENPRFTNRTYVVRGRQSRRAAGTSFTACPDAKLVYDSYVDITNWVPAVGLIDQSSKAFGDGGVTFGYVVDGSALTLNAHGAVSFGYGTSARISSTYSWSTGTLRKQEARSFAFASDG